ncbi:MAG: TIGR02678 family protein [Streptomycetaceae bacterium]|nr:TIGR02678 family protein [Streptomycetaceae bacterium]
MSSTAASQVTDALDLKRVAERRRAVRALLRHPLLTPAGPDTEAYRLARRHAGWLADWFAREAGWSLLAEPAVVRLRKTSGQWADGSRPAVAAVGARIPFSRRRYVLTCLALAVLERSESQVTLGRLVEQIAAWAADARLAAAGIVFTLDNREERADLAAVARLLLDIGVLARVAGDEQAFVNATGDVLYDVDRAVLSSLLVVRRGPSLVDPQGTDPVDARIAAVSDEPVPDTEDARNRQIRHRLSRRLLDDPVLYYADLDPDEQEYFARQRGPMLRRLTEASGLTAEVRAEGVALIDSVGEATDIGMPEEGTDGHATLLIAEKLAERLRRRPGEPIRVSALHRQVAKLVDEHRAHWRKSATEPGAERELTALALRRLRALGLVELIETAKDGEGEEAVRPLPALARFSYAPARIVGTGGRAAGKGRAARK